MASGREPERDLFIATALRELRKCLGLVGMEKAGWGLWQEEWSLDFDSLWCTGKQSFSVHSLQILTCVQGNNLLPSLSSPPVINQMQGTKYVRTSQVTRFSPSVHFCLVLESLWGCILAWMSTFSLPNFPYILVRLWSILHFQCLFCILRKPTVSNYTLSWPHFSNGRSDWELLGEFLVPFPSL